MTGKEVSSSIFSKRQYVIFFLIFISSLTLLLFFLVLFVLFFFNFLSNTTRNLYSISNYNPSTNKSSSGVVSVSRKLSFDDFISYFNSFGEYSVIIGASSNILEKKYECKVTCKCPSDSDERRIATSLTSQGLYFIVSAISLAMAMKVSKEYFLQKCASECGIGQAGFGIGQGSGFSIELFEDEDEEEGLEDVLSDEQCEKLWPILKPHIEEEERQLQWFCWGHCLDVEEFRTNKFTSEKLKKTNCVKMDVYGDIIFEDKTDTSVKMDRHAAKLQFLEDWLTPLCGHYSHFEYFPNGEEEEHGVKVSLCKSHDLEKDPEIQNVRCHLDDRKLDFIEDW